MIGVTCALQIWSKKRGVRDDIKYTCTNLNNRSNTWMGRTRIDGPDEFEPSKFDCIFKVLVKLFEHLSNLVYFSLNILGMQMDDKQ